MAFTLKRPPMYSTYCHSSSVRLIVCLAMLGHATATVGGGVWEVPMELVFESMNDYAGAWSSERGRCFRFVYTSDEHGRPTNCPGRPVKVGWTQDHRVRWYVVDACEEHASQLQGRPQRPSG